MLEPPAVSDAVSVSSVVATAVSLSAPAASDSAGASVGAGPSVAAGVAVGFRRRRSRAAAGGKAEGQGSQEERKLLFHGVSSSFLGLVSGWFHYRAQNRRCKILMFYRVRYAF